MKICHYGSVIMEVKYGLQQTFKISDDMGCSDK